MGVAAGAALPAKPARASQTEAAGVGLPFAGKWGYNGPVTSPYTDSNSSHPSVHHTTSGWNWATDLYGAPGAAVKFKPLNPSGAATYSWVPSSTSCGTSTRIKIAVDGVDVGEVYYAHLVGTVTTGPITDGMTLGTVADLPCNPGHHTHLEFRNLTGTERSCYVNLTMNVAYGEGTWIGNLGAPGVPTDRTECPPGTTAGGPIPATTDGTTLAVGSHTTGEVDVFWRGSGDELVETWYSGGTWHGPITFGMGGLKSAPAVAVQSSGEVDVFWRDAANHLVQAWYVGGSWHGPVTFAAGGMTSAPTAVAWGNDVDVFWRGANGDLVEMWYSSGAWHGPVSLNAGPLDSAPTAAASTAGIVDVFWRGADQNLWKTRYADGAWTGKQPLGMGPLGSAPSATVRHDGEQDVVWRSTNGDLLQAYYDGTWYGPLSLGVGALGSAPAMTSWGTEVDVFWRAANGSLQEKWYNGVWNGPAMPTAGPIPAW